jgi:hypothetical protein
MYQLCDMGHEAREIGIHRASSLSFLFEVMIGKVHHGVPVVRGDLVFTRAEVVADGALDELVGSCPGHFGGSQAVGTQ